MSVSGVFARPPAPYDNRHCIWDTCSASVPFYLAILYPRPQFILLLRHDSYAAGTSLRISLVQTGGKRPIISGIIISAYVVPTSLVLQPTVTTTEDNLDSGAGSSSSGDDASQTIAGAANSSRRSLDIPFIAGTSAGVVALVIIAAVLIIQGRRRMPMGRITM